MSALRLKLTYFDVTGRAELTRLIFVYGNVSFVDERLSQSQFDALKPTLPLGQVPILEVGDGNTFVQSMAIARYAAKVSGLYPQDPIVALRADMISETLSELGNKFSGILRGGFDEPTKAQKFQSYKDETVPKAFAALESMVQGKFLAGDDENGDMSYADVQLFNFVENLLWARLALSISQPFPKLRAVVDNVKSVPNIAAYLAKHQK